MIVRVPASSANLGPGFDSLGMALSLHLEASTDGPVGDERLGAGAGVGAGAGAAPVDAHHPTAVAFERLGGVGPVWVRSPIPMGRGLGFSGAARVAGLLLAAAQRGAPDVVSCADEVLAHGTALEGHADNVAASLHGGVVATADDLVVRVPLALDPVVVVWVPDGVQTSTDASRTTVRRPLAFDDAVFNVGRTAVLVAALAAGAVGALRRATEDRLHQDLRLAAVPGSRAALSAMEAAGAWCAWLSGSGPTVAGLCGLDAVDAVAAALPGDGHVKTLRIDHSGAVLER